MLEEAGFQDVRVVVREEARDALREWMPGSNLERYVASATIEGKKPGASCCAPSCCAPETAS